VRRRLSLAPAAIALATALLAGCAMTGSPETGASPAATPTTTPTSTPVTTSLPGIPETCEDLVDDATLADYAAGGYTLSADFEQRAAVEGWPIRAFVAYGGLLCQWGYPASDASDAYGYAPITAEQAEEQRQGLLAEGFASSDALGGTVLQLASEYVTEYYLFVDGSWYYSTRGMDALEEMHRNVAG
jgi:hypothetical protein